MVPETEFASVSGTFIQTVSGTTPDAFRWCFVPVYFFDTRDGDDFIEDDIGLELPDLERARMVASKSLAELARDVLSGSVKRTMLVEVRDEQGPVIMA